jgi:hypothetical protein
MRCSQHYVMQRMYPNSFGMKIAAFGGMSDSFYVLMITQRPRRRCHARFCNVSSDDLNHSHRPTRITTTLYDLVEALSTEVEPADDYLVTAVHMPHQFRSCALCWPHKRLDHRFNIPGSSRAQTRARRQDAVVVVSEGGLGYRDHSQEYGQRVGVSHTLVGYQVVGAARARGGA